ncbi:alpha-glucuronidase [Microbacterium sp. HD4P20]|uniref:alpha-glucuronidase n=1 Tax=Microbacterium sp. HD4P20 TaxID=2864874 RepID=UPI001C642C31|nr:alpha-glucuronidase [Microbacterium sp. HD4P20]MCP2637956.1 alpha-glucuronidase [Microbacterium sp. HD4P20]
MTVHSMWLPDDLADREDAGLRDRSIAITGEGALLETVRRDAAALGLRLVDVAGGDGTDILVEPAAAADALGPESFTLTRETARTVVRYGAEAGALYGWFQLLREAAQPGTHHVGETTRHEPAHDLRMLDHWDNVAVHPVMGQVERGYAGGSIFYDDGRLRDDLTRVERYARLLASIGINRVAINNVNVHAREARLLTDDLPGVARLAGIFREWGIRTHLSVSFAAPLTLGGLGTSDPLDDGVQGWWAETANRVYAAIPDFGGFVVKADSEGQPGPFAYGRSHAEGANMLARALAPHGGMVHWRAFVYNHRQDWRDRSTDRARAAYDHFAPLDGQFDDNVVLQVKYGPLDFQTREPVSPVIPVMRDTRVALELQVTQEYTGHQLHAVYLAPQWREILDFRPFGDDGPAVAEIVRGGIVAVSNIGDDAFWTGHPLAQANLYAYGRLAWDPTLDPAAILDEWIALTFGSDQRVRDGIHSILDDSWRTYESYTAPLGVGFMVSPQGHYGPAVDGYEYSPWGTYHFADRDGIGVDRTVATGTGYAGQYPSPWREAYESLDTVPDELLLFFHHVPYTHRLRSGSTVIQHIYDTHFAGVEAVEALPAVWAGLEGRVDAALHARVNNRLAEQVRSAVEWRDQINTYFWRKSGIPDEHGRTIY